jgi:hypothetical protein
MCTLRLREHKKIVLCALHFSSCRLPHFLPAWEFLHAYLKSWQALISGSDFLRKLSGSLDTRDWWRRQNGKIDKYVLNMGRASYNAICNILYIHAGSFKLIFMYTPSICVQKSSLALDSVYWRVIDSAISMENMFWSCLYHAHNMILTTLHLANLVNAVVKFLEGSHSIPSC